MHEVIEHIPLQILDQLILRIWRNFFYKQDR